jgi:hypothetical protein
MKPFLAENPPDSAWSTLGAHLEATSEDFAAFVEMMKPLPMSAPGSLRLKRQESRSVKGDSSRPESDTAAESPIPLVTETGASEESPTKPPDSPQKPVECLTFLTAVTDGGRQVMEAEDFSKTVAALPQVSPRLDSSSLRKRANNVNKAKSCVVTKLSSAAYSQRTGGNNQRSMSPEELDRETPGEMLLLGSTSPRLVAECFAKIRREGLHLAKRPDRDILHELSPRGNNPPDPTGDLESRKPRKPPPPPLWQACVRPIEESRESKRLWRQISQEAVSVGTEGQRKLLHHGRVVVPPPPSGDSPSSRSLRWKSLT